MNANFFSSFCEAEQAYKKWKTQDPFPDISPALLNSADISDYVRLTGMIYPFYKQDLKGATYTVRLKGLCVSFEENDKLEIERKVFCIGKDSCELPNYEENTKYEIKMN